MAGSAALVLVLVVAGSLVAAPARADHGDPWLVTAPAPGSPLPANGVILLVSANGPDPRVTEHRRYRFRLTAPGTAPIALRSTELRRGVDWNGYGRSHLLLIPEQPLPTGTTCQLEARGPGEAFEPLYAAQVLTGPTVTYGGGSVEAAWPIGALDREAPRWRSSPAVDGPTVVADVEGAVWFEVWAERGGRSTRRLADRTTHEPIFGVSDEGCDGVLLDGDGGPVVLTLVPHDAADNAGPARRFSIEASPEGGFRLCTSPPADDY